MVDSTQRGATMIEYALIIALIALVVVAIEKSIGESTYNAILKTSNSIDNASAPLR